MSRARVLGALLALILLACAVVIFLDQSGALGGDVAGSTPGTPPVTETGPADTSAGGDGYGDLR